MTPDEYTKKLDDVFATCRTTAGALLLAMMLTLMWIVPMVARFALVAAALGWVLQQSHAATVRAAATGAWFDFIGVAIWCVVLMIWWPRTRRFLIGDDDAPGAKHKEGGA